MPIIPGRRPNATKINALSQSILLRALYNDPVSIEELEEITGLGNTCIRNYLIALRKAKLVRIGGWDTAKNGAAVIPLFEWAPDKKDVPKPVKSDAQRSRESRARKKLKELHHGLTNPIAAS